MYVEHVPNRNSPPCTLLRESYRHGGKVKKRTVTNLSKWPPHLVEGLRKLLQGGVVVDSLEDCFDIERSLPHGHVAAVLGTLRKLGLDRIIGGRGSREHALNVAMIVARLIDPQSKLATQVEAGAGAQFGTDVVVRIEAAENEATAVQEQDQRPVVTRFIAIVAQRNLAVTPANRAVAGSYAPWMWVAELAHQGLVVDTLPGHAGRRRKP